MAIINLLEYKALAGIIDDDSQDEQIEQLIPQIESDYLMIRGADFETDDEDATIYPTGAKLTAAEMLSYKLQTIKGNVGTSSEGTSKYSHTYDFRKTRGYPTYIVSKIRSFARAR